MEGKKKMTIEDGKKKVTASRFTARVEREGK